MSITHLQVWVSLLIAVHALDGGKVPIHSCPQNTSVRLEFYHENSTSWDDANQFCLKRGGKLMAPSDVAIESCLQSETAEAKSFDGDYFTSLIWLEVSKKNTSSVTYQHCLAIRWTNIMEAHSELLRESCQAKHHIVCKFYYPETKTTDYGAYTSKIPETWQKGRQRCETVSGKHNFSDYVGLEVQQTDWNHVRKTFLPETNQIYWIGVYEDDSQSVSIRNSVKPVLCSTITVMDNRTQSVRINTCSGTRMFICEVPEESDTLVFTGGRGGGGVSSSDISMVIGIGVGIFCVPLIIIVAIFIKRRFEDKHSRSRRRRRRRNRRKDNEPCCSCTDLKCPLFSCCMKGGQCCQCCKKEHTEGDENSSDNEEENKEISPDDRKSQCQCVKCGAISCSCFKFLKSLGKNSDRPRVAEEYSPPWDNVANEGIYATVDEGVNTDTVKKRPKSRTPSGADDYDKVNLKTVKRELPELPGCHAYDHLNLQKTDYSHVVVMPKNSKESGTAKYSSVGVQTNMANT